MELSSQLEKRGMRLQLEWCEREDNQDADDLSKMRTENFALENRIPIDVRTVPWIMLDKVMRLGADFEKLRSERKATAKTRLTKRKAEPLRITDPW